jgi:hypothetical protein
MPGAAAKETETETKADAVPVDLAGRWWASLTALTPSPGLFRMVALKTDDRARPLAGCH